MAIGPSPTASGEYSTAIGTKATAYGSHSFAIGNNVTASSYGEFVVGQQNTTPTPNSTTEWNENDRLFVIGNGNGKNKVQQLIKSDALVVLKNGNTTINGALTTGGNIMPTTTESYNLGNATYRWNNVYGRYGNFVNSTSVTGVNITNSFASSTTQSLKSVNNGATSTGYALYGSAESTSASSNYGVYGTSSGAKSNNYGVYGTANGAGTANGGVYNYGVRGYSYANGYSDSYKNTNYGVYGYAGGSNATNWAGYFSGNVKVTGTINGTTVGSSSDMRLKKNIQQLGGALDKVLKLRGVSYYWKNKEELMAMPNTMEDDSTMCYLFDDKKQIGVIAQEVETIVPEVVLTDPNGYKAVDYSKLTPVLIEAMKEQQAIIESQQKEIDELKAQMREILEKLK